MYILRLTLIRYYLCLQPGDDGGDGIDCLTAITNCFGLVSQLDARADIGEICR